MFELWKNKFLMNLLWFLLKRLFWLFLMLNIVKERKILMKRRGWKGKWLKMMEILGEDDGVVKKSFESGRIIL